MIGLSVDLKLLVMYHPETDRLGLTVRWMLPLDKLVGWVFVGDF